VLITGVRVQVPPRAPKRHDILLDGVSFYVRGAANEPDEAGLPPQTGGAFAAGKRSRSGAIELSPRGGSEGCAACGDAVPPRAPNKDGYSNKVTVLIFSAHKYLLYRLL